MTEKIQSHQVRPVEGELRELHEIAQREHGPEARSTRLIREALDAAREPQRSPRELGERRTGR